MHHKPFWRDTLRLLIWGVVIGLPLALFCTTVYFQHLLFFLRYGRV